MAIVQMNQNDEPWVVSWKTGARCYPCISQVWDLSDWGLAKPFAVALTEQGLYIIWICLDLLQVAHPCWNWLWTGCMVGNPFRITSMIISYYFPSSNMFQPSWRRNLPMILQQKLAALEVSQSSNDVPNRQEDRKVDMELLPVRNSVHPVLWFLDILSHFIPTDFHGRKSGSHATLRSQWVAVRAHEGWLKGPCSMKVWMDMESGEKDSYLYYIFTIWALDHVSVPHCTIMVCEVPAKISEVNAYQCYVLAYLGGDSMGFHGIPMCVGQVMSCDMLRLSHVTSCYVGASLFAGDPYGITSWLPRAGDIRRHMKSLLVCYSYSYYSLIMFVSLVHIPCKSKVM